MAGEINVEQPIIKKIETAPVKIEKQPFSENKTERVLPKIEKKVERPEAAKDYGAGNIVAASQAADYQKQRAAAIDEILSSGLNEVFLKMNPAQQANFKKTGEETVAKINLLLSEAKVKVNKIVDLIRKWLQLIPGINKFFLEQEVKIKVDKIMKIKNKF